MVRNSSAVVLDVVGWQHPEQKTGCVATQATEAEAKGEWGNLYLGVELPALRRLVGSVWPGTSAVERAWLAAGATVGGNEIPLGLCHAREQWRGGAGFQPWGWVQMIGGGGEECKYIYI